VVILKTQRDLRFPMDVSVLVYFVLVGYVDSSQRLMD